MFCLCREGSVTKIVRDVPAEPRKFDILYTNFSPNYPPISVLFSIKNYSILPKFHNNLLKVHPIFEFGKFHEKAPQKAGKLGRVFKNPVKFRILSPIRNNCYVLGFCYVLGSNIRISCQCENPSPTCASFFTVMSLTMISHAKA